ncbi:MAG: PAC2 family protein, partial [Acidimicrobiales bacterium]
MDHLHWRSRPVLQRPVLLVAFEGWNDAGDAASGAVRYLIDRYDAELVAEIDPEDFFDFTSTRPQAELGDDGVRRISWPSTEVYA